MPSFVVTQITLGSESEPTPIAAGKGTILTVYFHMDSQIVPFCKALVATFKGALVWLCTEVKVKVCHEAIPTLERLCASGLGASMNLWFRCQLARFTNSLFLSFTLLLLRSSFCSSFGRLHYYSQFLL